MHPWTHRAAAYLQTNENRGGRIARHPRRQMTLGVPSSVKRRRRQRFASVYIMSGGIPGEDVLSSGISVTTAWVVSTMAAIEAAF